MENIYSQRLIALLEEKNLTQRELALKVGVQEATISRYINGSRNPHSVIVAKIAEVLETTTDYLLGRDLPPKIAEPQKINKVENSQPPDIWNELTEKERKEAEDFMRWLKSKRGITDENAVSGQ